MVQVVRDSAVNRLIISGSGGGVTSLNGETGDVTITSNGGTITITTPTADTINLETVTGGSGDVTGPASSTDNAVARFDGTTGKIIQNSGATIDDSGNLTATNFSGSSSGTNTGDVTLSGENYLNLAGQAITANSVNLSGTNATGTLAAGRFPALTGDVTTSAGSLTTAIAAGVIVNADVNAAAAIDYSKLAALTVNRALVSDGSGVVSAATTTATEIGYVNGVTSAIQTQLNGKQATGNYITALTGDVTASGPGSSAATLATVNSNTGTFGSATQVAQPTVNAKGLITAISSVAIQIAESQVTNLTTDLAGKQPLDAALTSIAGVSWVQGDLEYWSGTDTASRLAKDTNASRYLSNTGTSNNPAWAQVDLSNGVTGDLPFANLTQITARSVLGVTGNSTADVAAIQGTADQVLRINGAGTALAFGAIDLSKTATATGVLQATSFPALTGDVTTSSGAVTTTIANSTVTNAKMANMATLTIKSNITGGSAAPGDNTVTAVLDTIGSTQGQILYRNGTVWTTLSPGTSGQVLQSGGPAANPSWLTVTGTGTVTTVSVVSANGFAGSVANATTTPAITISTTITGVLKGNGTAISAATSGTDYVAPGTATVFTAQQNFQSVSLTDAATITWNANTQQVAKVLLTSGVGATRALGAPSNLVDGGTYILKVTQSATGSNALTYNAVYKWPGGTPPVLSTANNAIDILTFISDGTNMYGVAQKAFA